MINTTSRSRRPVTILIAIDDRKVCCQIVKLSRVIRTIYSTADRLAFIKYTPVEK